MTLTIPSISTEYVRMGFLLERDGEFVDPTGYAVSLNYTASPDTAPVDWVSGSWEVSDGTYYARVLTGPTGAVNPGPGTWVLWAKVTASPEAPVRCGGLVVIHP